MKKLAWILAVWLLVIRPAGAVDLKTRNVVLVTMDGVRWQEVFRGADETILNLESGGMPEKAVLGEREKYLAATPEARRLRLLPFFWGEIAEHGQLYGNRDVGSQASVTNGLLFSYPGYNELLSGHPDPRITSNDFVPNPNVTVLEWLNQRPALAGQVVACAAWRAFPAILNVERSGLTLWVTGQHSTPNTASPRLAQIEQWMDDIPSPWPNEHFDAFVYRAALDFIEFHRPRVLYVAFGEPDEWGHARRYDRYLESIGRCDRFIRELWEKLQSMPQYQGTTTLIISPDHGRGSTSQDWMNHGKKAPGSIETWLVVLGPDTPPLGERRNSAPITQAQIASTVAQLLGEDYRSAVPAAAAALSEVIAPNGK